MFIQLNIVIKCLIVPGLNRFLRKSGVVMKKINYYLAWLTLLTAFINGAEISEKYCSSLRSMSFDQHYSALVTSLRKKEISWEEFDKCERDLVERQRKIFHKLIVPVGKFTENNDDETSGTVLLASDVGVDYILCGALESFSEEALSLKIIYLTRNHLTYLPPGVFKGLSRLEMLALNHNKIRNLKPGVFKGLSGLKYLHLGENSLTNLSGEVFKGLNELEHLILYENQLTSFDPSIVKEYLPKLKCLDLSFNKLPEDKRLLLQKGLRGKVHITF